MLLLDTFENAISSKKFHEKQNYEKLEHIWEVRKQNLLKTTLFTSKINNISISRSRNYRQSKNEILKLQ